MTSNNELRHYAQRLAAIDEEIDELRADRRELEAEARTQCGINIKALRKWVSAERRDKVEETAQAIADDVAYGEMLGHAVLNDSKEDARPLLNKSKQDAEAKPEASATASEPTGTGEDPDHATMGAGHSGSRLPAGRTVDGERHLTSGVTSPGGENPAPIIPERGEDVLTPQHPEATPIPSPPKENGETAAIDYFEMPFVADRRNWVDGRPPEMVKKAVGVEA